MKSFKVFMFSALCSVLVASNVHHDPHYKPNRSIIVHLFEWKFNDIATECETYLGPNGFAGVQVSPVSENVVIDKRPWYERYQPISYHIITRSGNEQEFHSMVKRCNRVGVRIYVDVVFNHMTAIADHAIGTGNSTADVPNRSYPAVSYGQNDFNPICSINNYENASEVRDCELVGLPDLNQSIPHVREKIVEFMNRLIDHGVAGFRIDAAKHMWPKDLEAIYGGLKSLKTPEFHNNSKPFIYQEVIVPGLEAVQKTEYTYLGAVTEFMYSEFIGRAFNGGIDLKALINWGPAWGMLPSDQAFVFVDNHDNQRADGDILTYKSARRYTMATAFMLGHPYGIARVMSSFLFDSSEQGPPADNDGTIISPKINANGQCENGWVCEHRWPAIRNMIAFRNVVRNAPVVNFWDNGKNQIAFCRGTRGFIAFNNEATDMNVKLFTCMPSGEYCDIITGNRENGKCSGTKVTVDENGEAQIVVPANIGVLAIHIGARKIKQFDAMKPCNPAVLPIRKYRLANGCN